MSEVVKKLVTELGFILKDQDKLKKYSDTAKTLVKTQKESEKVQKQSNATTQKGLTLKEKEKQAIKQETTLKKQALIEEGKLKAKLITEESKLRRAQIKGLKTAEEDSAKAKQKFKDDINKRNDAKLKDQSKRIKTDKANLLKQEETHLKSKQKLNDDINKRNDAKLKLQSKNIKKDNEQIFKQEQERLKAKQKLTDDINKRNQSTLKQQQNTIEKSILNDVNIRARNRANAYDRTLNFGASQRSSTFDSRMNKVLERRGKMIDPQNPNRIIPIPTTKPKYQVDKEVLGQTAVDIGTRIGQKTQEIVMGSIDIMLEYEKRLNELQVRGELSPEQLKDMDKSVKDSASTWGSDILETQKIGIELAKTGLQGDMLKFMIEESTMLGRSFGTSPQIAKDVLNTVLHQQGKNIQSPEAIKKGTPITQDKEAIKKASNMLSAAVNYSALDASQLQYYMKYSGVGAGQKGVSFEEYLNNAMRYSMVSLLGSTPGTSERKITEKLYTGLSGAYETQNFKVGKKKGKKGSELEKAYDLRDFVNKDISTYIGKDKKGLNYFRKELLLSDLMGGMDKKKLNMMQKQLVLQEIGGLTANQALTVLTKTETPEEKKARQSLKDANKRNETQRTAKALMQNPKSKLEQVKTKKDIAMINLGQEFKPEVGMFTNASNYLLDKFNTTPSLRKTGKRTAYMGMGAGIGAGVGGLLGSIFMGPGVGTLAGGAGGMALGLQVGAMLNDTIAVINKYKPSIGTALNGITSLFKTLSNNVKPYIDSISASFTNLINKVMNFFNLPTTKTFDVKINGGGRNFGFSGLPSSSSSEKPISKAIKNVNRSLVTKGAK